MYLHWSHRTSGVGAGRYCAALFESPQIVTFVTSFADDHYRVIAERRPAPRKIDVAA
jgi:hypothetical protein